MIEGGKNIEENWDLHETHGESWDVYILLFNLDPPQ